MPGYFQETYNRTSYFERSVIAVAYLKLDKPPERFMGRKAREDLKEALHAEANKATHYLSAGLLELKPEVKVREGCLIVEIVVFLAESLSKLLSQPYLEDVELRDLVSEGISDRGKLHIARTAFRAIKRLKSQVERVVSQLIVAINHHLGLTIKDTLSNSVHIETSTGILEVLDRLSKNLQVAGGNYDIRRRLPAMKRVKNVLMDIEGTVKNAKDRSYLCNLLRGILTGISKDSPTGARNQIEHYKKQDFNLYLDDSRFILNLLCTTR